MNKNKIKSICWDITSQCNEHCGFCYRNQNNKELDFESNKIILKKLIDFGVDKISFVGGEPLLYSDLFKLIEWGKFYAKNKTIFSITTNAILLTNIIDNKIVVDEEKINKISELFDWITLSLDAPNSILQSLMGRNVYHYDRVVAILGYINLKSNNKKVKINTVVSKINIDSMMELYNELCEYNVKRWKVFRFLPSRGSALELKNRYFISEELFANKMLEIEKCNVYNKIKISVNGYDTFDNSYVTISSEGQLVVYDGQEYMNKTDLLKDDVSDILQYIDIEKHIKKRSDFLQV